MYNQVVEIVVTFPNIEEAKQVSKVLFGEKLIACVNYSRIMSEYVWEGEVKNEEEILVSYKTSYNNKEYIKGRIEDMHTYEVPMILIKTVEANDKYERWVLNSIVSV